MTESQDEAMRGRSALDWIPSATTAEVKALNSRIAVLPIGSFEQHGPHLPLATDTIVACAIASRLSDTYGLFQLPPITISCSHEHSGWPGTVSISSSTLTQTIDDMRNTLTASGVDSLALVNAHGGNYVLSNVVQQANASAETPRITLYPGRDEWTSARTTSGMVTSNHEDMHAGELETSILLHVAPKLVGDSYRSADHTADRRPHLLITGLRGYTENGVIGRPSLATARKGSAALESLTEQFNTHLKRLS